MGGRKYGTSHRDPSSSLPHSSVLSYAFEGDFVSEITITSERLFLYIIYNFLSHHFSFRERDKLVGFLFHVSHRLVLHFFFIFDRIYLALYFSEKLALP